MNIKPVWIGLILTCHLVLSCNEVQAKIADTTFCQTEDCQSDLKQLEKMAKYGSGEAATILALAYATGEGVAQDTDRARQYLKQAVRWREPMAMHQMSRWMREGFVFEKSLEHADDWLNRAVNLGFAPALTDKAKLLLKLDNAEYDKEAIELLQQASDKHFRPASYLLAQLYASGFAVETNIGQAGLLYKELAIIDYEDSRQRLDQIITALEDISQTVESDTASDLSILLTELKQIDNIEVIQVTGSKLNVNSELSNIVTSLTALKIYSNRINTGSRIPGNLCGRSTSTCYTVFDRRIAPDAPFGASNVGELLKR